MSAPIIPAGYWTRKDLATRGWTLSLIKKLMPKADAKQEGTRGIYRIEVSLYRIERVEAAMETPEFQAAVAKRIYRGTAGERRRAAFERKYSNWTAALPAACAGLHALNRFAKHASRARHQQQEIYALKNELVCLLYGAGYCGACWIHELTLPAKICRECGGEGFDCDRCDGTGNYLPAKTLRFYCFKFDIGRGYAWHQPDHLVKFAVSTTEPPRAWAGVEREKPLGMPRSEFAEAKELISWVLDRAQNGPPAVRAEHFEVGEPVGVAGVQEGLFA